MVSIDANPKLGYIDMNGVFVDGVDVDPKKNGGSGSCGTYGASAWFANHPAPPPKKHPTWGQLHPKFDVEGPTCR